TGFQNPDVKVGDYNGDGNPDLLVFSPDAFSSSCSFTSDRYAVLYGDGRGGFSPPATFTLAQRPSAFETGDLNGDGKTDLVFIGCSESGGFYVMLSSGAGGFASPVRYDLGAGAISPKSALVGDFNGDGKPDVVVTNSNTGNLSILIGDGGGGFGPATILALAEAPVLMAAGDFNDDGAADLAVTRNESGNIAVLLNRAGCPPANGVVTVSAASYAPHRAAGEAIVSAFGSGLAERPETATTIPLPTWLAGVTVKVKDSAGAERPAPL